MYLDIIMYVSGNYLCNQKHQGIIRALNVALEAVVWYLKSVGCSRAVVVGQKCCLLQLISKQSTFPEI